MQWPKEQRQKPFPFKPEERDRILAFFREKEPFYYPRVLMAFTIGTRPSEAIGLLISDVDIERGEISITKSRHLGADARPKPEGASGRLAFRLHSSDL